MSWQVEWTDRALKDADRLDGWTKIRVLNAIERFAETERGDVRQLRGPEQEWRLRVGGWRVKIALDQRTNTLTVLRVLPAVLGKRALAPEQLGNASQYYQYKLPEAKKLVEATPPAKELKRFIFPSVFWG